MGAGGFPGGFEHTVDEFHGIRARKPSAKLKRLVDDDRWRILRNVPKLVERQPQNVAVNGGNPFEFPMLGVSANQAVKHGRFFHCALE